MIPPTKDRIQFICRTIVEKLLSQEDWVRPVNSLFEHPSKYKIFSSYYESPEDAVIDHARNGTYFTTLTKSEFRANYSTFAEVIDLVKSRPLAPNVSLYIYVFHVDNGESTPAQKLIGESSLYVSCCVIERYSVSDVGADADASEDDVSEDASDEDGSWEDVSEDDVSEKDVSEDDASECSEFSDGDDEI